MVTVYFPHDDTFLALASDSLQSQTLEATMIGIQLVLINGQLVGRRFQDRWNLAQLKIISIPYSRNQSALKKRRRESEGFTFTTVKGEMVPISQEERRMFTTTYSRMVA